MRRLVCPLLCVLLLVAVGCGGEEKARLRGHWKGRGVEGIDKGNGFESASSFARSMEIEFRDKDLTVSFVSKAGPQRISSPYRIVHQEKGQVVIAAALDDGEEEIFQFPTDHTLAWALEIDKRVMFERVD